MQAPQEVINNLIHTVVAAQQATATTAQRREAIDLSEQVSHSTSRSVSRSILLIVRAIAAPRCACPFTPLRRQVNVGGEAHVVFSLSEFCFLQLKRGEPRSSVQIALQLVQSSYPVEVEHFGYTVLQHVVSLALHCANLLSCTTRSPIPKWPVA